MINFVMISGIGLNGGYMEFIFILFILLIGYKLAEIIYDNL